MKREVIAEAVTVDEAIDEALSELGVQQDAVEYEVLDEPGKKLFGLGTEKLARVRVWLKDEFLARLERDEHDADTGAVENAEIAPEVVPTTSASRLTDDEPELTDEEIDRVADEAVSTIQSILGDFGIDAEIEEYEGDEGEIILDIVGGDLGQLIGRHGRTLDAMQVLVSAITNRRVGFRFPMLVDVEGYRNRRREKLEEMALRAAERAIRQHSAVKLRPMSSLERRVVHMALRDDGRVVTASEGEEPFRAVVVSPKGR